MYHKLHIMGTIVSSDIETKGGATFLKSDIRIITKKGDKIYHCIHYKDKFHDLDALKRIMEVGKVAVVVGTPIMKKEGKTVIVGINVTEYPTVDSDEKINLIGWVGGWKLDTKKDTDEKVLCINLVVKPYKDTDKTGVQHEYWYKVWVNSHIVNIEKVALKLQKNKLLYVTGTPYNKVITWKGEETISRGCIVTEMPLFLSKDKENG